MNRLSQDIRFGLRMMLKHPTLSIVAVITFGLGIGLTTTVFSIVNGTFYKGLPFEEADRIVCLWNTDLSRDILDMAVSVHDYAAFVDRQTTFESIGFFTFSSMNLAGSSGQPERFTGAQISPNTPDILRVKPILGRSFRAGDGRPGTDPAVMISYSIWRDRFGSSKDVLGRTVRVNGVARTIIGVMPKGFAFPGFESLWIPLEIDPQATVRGKGPSYLLFGRLKRGVTIKQASAQVAAIAADLEKQYPETNRGISATVRPYSENFLRPQVYAFLYTMLGASVGVLLIACVNVANLLLARTSSRTREFAIRMALGGCRSRILTQLLTEALVLALAGGLFGFWFSTAAIAWFVSVLALNPLPFWIRFGPDYRVMLFVTGITLAAGVFAGLVPALRAGRTNISETLKDESRSSKGQRVMRFSSTLIVAEVAISGALLIAAGLMIKNIVNLKTIKMPFAVDGVFTARINFPQIDYPDAASRLRFHEQLLPKLQGIPGVEDATLCDGLPATVSGNVPFQIEGHVYPGDRDNPVARQAMVTPGYFRTYQTRVLQGRDFTELDRQDTLPVTIVNQSFARVFFPERNAIGKRIRKASADSKSPWLIIVGIVPDLLMEGLGNTNRGPAGFYIPMAQSDAASFVSIALRTQDEPMRVAAEVRAAVASLNRDMPIFNAMSMKDLIRRQSWFSTVFGTLFLALGLSALFLALAGLYAIMSFAVAQRKREIGIRAALGATGSQLMRLIISRGIIQLAVGLALGLALGLLLVNPLQPFLIGPNPRDPALIVTVVAALAASGLLANLIPAARAMKISAVMALAAE